MYTHPHLAGQLAYERQCHMLARASQQRLADILVFPGQPPCGAPLLNHPAAPQPSTSRRSPPWPP